MLTLTTNIDMQNARILLYSAVCLNVLTLEQLQDNK